MSGWYGNTLQLKDLSDASDEHQLPIVLWILGVSLNELTDCTTHQVRLVDLIGVADVGHLVFEDFWKSQTGLVWVFLHSSNSPVIYFLNERLCIHEPCILVRDSGWVTSDFLTLLSASTIYLSLVALTDWLKFLESLSIRRESICFCWVCFSFWCSSLRLETSRGTKVSLSICSI